jgi:hypothetical protein
VARLVEAISLHFRPHLTGKGYSLPCFPSCTNPCATIQVNQYQKPFRPKNISFILTLSPHFHHHTRYPLPLCTHVLSNIPDIPQTPPSIPSLGPQ